MRAAATTCCCRPTWPRVSLREGRHPWYNFEDFRREPALNPLQVFFGGSGYSGRNRFAGGRGELAHEFFSRGILDVKCYKVAFEEIICTRR